MLKFLKRTNVNSAPTQQSRHPSLIALSFACTLIGGLGLMVISWAGLSGDIELSSIKGLSWATTTFEDRIFLVCGLSCMSLVGGLLPQYLTFYIPIRK